MSKKLLTWGDMDSVPSEPLVEIEADVEKPAVVIYPATVVLHRESIEMSYDDALKLYHRLGECLGWLYQEGLATERPGR